MGVLQIDLKEGKGFEAKDFGGTSDPFVKFSIPSLNDEEKGDSIKSRVIKKNLFPQWNETLLLSLSSPTGHSLKIVAKDWNRLSKAEFLGEVTIPLDDLKPGAPKVFNNLSLEKGKGFLSFVLTFKPTASNTVYVSYESQPLIRYDLLRNVKLSSQLDVLCQLVGATESYEHHTLWFNDKILTDQNLKDPSFNLPAESIIKLIVKPNVQVQSVLETLKNGPPEAKKKTIFDLKKQLEDPSFTQAFIQAHGISALTNLILSSTGNTLAYGLVALDSAMAHGFGWDISPQMVSRLVKLLQEESNVNVIRAASKIFVHLAGSKNHGYPALLEAMRKETTPYAFYGKIISNILSSDEGIQCGTLELINCIITSTPDKDKDELIQILEEHLLTMKIKGIFDKSNDALRKLVSRYLKLKHGLHTDPPPYNKENPEHEKLLLELWNTVFPDTKLESRISEHWKWMGFQGTDPATDFRGMGIIGLKHLLYFCKTNTATARMLMITQTENSSSPQLLYYPVAVAGITISTILFELFGEIDNQPKLFSLLLDHSFALEEIYCICLKYFDALWEEFEASYMDFSRIINSFKNSVKEFLFASNNIEQFNQKCSVKDSKDKKKKKKDDKKKDEKKSGVALVTKRPLAKFIPKENIHEFVKSGNTAKVLELLKEGVSIDEKDNLGNTLLHTAVLLNSLEMVQLLLWKDADVTMRNNDGWTVLHEAAKNSNLDIIMALLKRGANPNIETDDGVIALHYLMSRHIDESQLPLVDEVLSEMADAGVQINANKNSNQETPLHYATSSRLITNVQLLINHGADVNAKNKRGYTSLHIAALQGQPEIVKILLKAGADTKISCKTDGTFEDIMEKDPIMKQVYDEVRKELTQNKDSTIRTKRANNRFSVALTQASTVQSFHPNLNRRTALAKCQAFGKNCFILCPSDVHGCFVLSTWNEKISKQYLVVPRPTGGYGLQDSPDIKTYASLSELASKSPLTAGLVTVPRDPELPDKSKSDPLTLALVEAESIIKGAMVADRSSPQWKSISENLKATLLKVTSQL